jgi:hypothetical protein
VANGHITPNEAAEIGKVIDAYVGRIKPPNWTNGWHCVEQLTESRRAKF